MLKCILYEYFRAYCKGLDLTLSGRELKQALLDALDTPYSAENCTLQLYLSIAHLRSQELVGL